jgi:hypothetical protein
MYTIVNDETPNTEIKEADEFTIKSAVGEWEN